MDYTLGLYEKSMPSDLSWRDMLVAVAASGFDHLEISIDESDDRQKRLDWSASKRLELVCIAQDTNVPIRTMCLSGHRKYPLGSHDANVRKQGMDMMKKAIDLAGNLGVRVIQLAGYDVYYETSDVRTKDMFTDNLRKSVEYAAQYGVAMGFETMETPFMDTISKVMEYLRYIDSPNLGLYPDLGNLNNACYLYGLNIRREIAAGKGHMFAMHLKETDEGKYRDMNFGDGRVNFVSGICEALSCGVRMFVAEFWHNGCEEWQKRLKDTNRFLRNAFDEAIHEGK